MPRSSGRIASKKPYIIWINGPVTATLVLESTPDSFEDFPLGSRRKILHSVLIGSPHTFALELVAAEVGSHVATRP